MKKFLVLFAVVLGVTLGALPPFPIVKDRRPVVTIELPQGADETLQFAAEELQNHIRTLTGCTVKIAPSGQFKLAVRPAGFAADLAKLRGTDGFAVRPCPGGVMILGDNSKGVLNGVSRLIIRNSDLIWARPNEKLGTICTVKPDFALTAYNYLDIPKFHIRGWQTISRKPDYPTELWKNRMGNNFSARSHWKPLKKMSFVQFYGGGHNLNGLYITEKKYFDQHPEYFPLLKGKRVRPSTRSHYTQLCFTNPELKKVFAQELDAHISRNPNYDIYNIMIEDNRLCCECAECLKPLKLADGTVVKPEDKNFRSTQFYLWLNEIIRYQRKRHPGKRYRSFAYLFTEPAPACQVEPEILIIFCPIFKNSKFDIDHPSNAREKQNLLKWLKRTPNVIWREYYGLVSYFPRPTYRVAASDFQKVYRWGVRHSYSEMYADNPGFGHNRVISDRSWDANGMSNWIMNQLLWDPFVPVDKIQQDYLQRVYQEGAPDVAEFHRLVEELWPQTIGRSYWYDVGLANYSASVFKYPERTAACRAALDRAAQKKMSPQGRLMLDRLRREFELNAKAYAASRLPQVRKTAQKVDFDPTFQTGDWKKCPVFDHFTLRGEAAQPPPVRTEMRTLYDQKNLYIGFFCEQPQIAELQCRNAGKYDFNEDGVSLLIKGRRGYFIGLDPAGNRINQPSRFKWQGQVAKTDRSWSALFTIPWSELGLDPVRGDTPEVAIVRYPMKKKFRGQLMNPFMANSGARRLLESLVPLPLEK